MRMVEQKYGLAIDPYRVYNDREVEQMWANVYIPEGSRYLRQYSTPLDDGHVGVIYVYLVPESEVARIIGGEHG